MTAAAFLAEHALAIALGSSGLLVVGLLAIRSCRQLVVGKRFGELSVVFTLVWLALVFVPLPRPGAMRTRAADSPTTTRTSSRTGFEGAAAVSQEHHDALPAATSPPATVRGPGVRGDTGSAMIALTPQAGLRGGGSSFRAPSAIGWTSAVWLIGACLAAGYLLFAAARLRWIMRHARPAPAWLDRLTAQLCPERGRTRVLVTTESRRPFCVGVRRPVIVLPSRLCQPDDADRLRPLLLHELGHAIHGDGRSRLLLAAAGLALWPHPLYWWLRRRIRQASELLADDWAAARVGKADYARGLIDLAGDLTRLDPAPLGTSTMFGSPSDFHRRIEMLMKRDHTLETRGSRSTGALHTATLALAVVVSTLVFGNAPIQAQDEGQNRHIAELTRKIDELTRKNRALLRQLEQAPTRAEPAPPQVAASSCAACHVAGDPLVNPHAFADEPAESCPAAAPTRLPAAADLDLLREASAERLTRRAFGVTTIAAPQADPPLPSFAPAFDPAILDLTSRAIALQGEVEMAQRIFASASALQGKALVTQDELRTAEIRLRTATRQYELVRSAIAAEIRLAKLQLASLAEGRGQTDGLRLQSAVLRIELRIELLQSSL